jgi:hypothetical protein
VPQESSCKLQLEKKDLPNQLYGLGIEIIHFNYSQSIIYIYTLNNDIWNITATATTAG